MDYKILINDVTIYYFPEFDKDLVLYINNPYYEILYLLIEMHLSEFKVEYKFRNFFDIPVNRIDYQNLLEMIMITLSTLLDYYILDYEIFKELVSYNDQNIFFNILNLMLPNNKNIFTYNNSLFTKALENIKYDLKNKDIYFITSDKNIYNSNLFSKIKKYVKRKKYEQKYVVPYKFFKSSFNNEEQVGIYLDQLNYFEYYVFDILFQIICLKGYRLNNIYVGKEFKILIIRSITKLQFKKLIFSLFNNQINVRPDLNFIIRNKHILDFINHNDFDLNIYNQVTSKDVTNLAKKIFKLNNIKYVGKS